MAKMGGKYGDVFDLNGIIINDRPFAPSTFLCRKLDGWFSSASIESDLPKRPYRDGAYVTNRWRSNEKYLTMEVVVKATSRAQRDEMIQRLGMAVTQERAVPLTRHEPVPKMAWVRVYGQIDVEIFNDYHATVILDLVAPDGRRFGTEQKEVYVQPFRKTPGVGLAFPLTDPLDFGQDSFGYLGGSVVNAGDADVYPVIDFRGEGISPLIRNKATGLVLEFDIILTSNETLTVDTDRGTVLLNGATDRSYLATYRSSPLEDFVLKPGMNEMSNSWLQEYGEPAGATVRWTDGYK